MFMWVKIQSTNRQRSNLKVSSAPPLPHPLRNCRPSISGRPFCFTFGDFFGAFIFFSKIWSFFTKVRLFVGRIVFFDKEVTLRSPPPLPVQILYATVDLQFQVFLGSHFVSLLAIFSDLLFFFENSTVFFTKIRLFVGRIVLFRRFEFLF